MNPAAVQDWRPTASGPMRRLRAEVNRLIREFFLARGVLEVETPLCSSYANPDPAIDSVRLADGAYLRTSPEFAHKRLLAAGAGPIYELGRVFRAGESGSHHNPEFSLLEWYRPGFDQQALMAEAVELIEMLFRARDTAVESMAVSFAEAVERACGIDPLVARDDEVAAVARRIAGAEGDLSRRESLDLLLSLGVATSFPTARVTCVYDFPACQAALARISEADPRVAHRFEIFCGPIEVANGYDELCDAVELEARLAADNARRAASGRPEMAPDPRLLAAARAGIDSCAGIALGVDRLLMALGGCADIAEVIEFPAARA